jgi:hypothetical protein
MDLNDHSEAHEYLAVPSSIDPIQKAHAESQTITESWLKHGERLTPVQRVGHGMLSFGYIIACIYFAQTTYEQFTDRAPLGVFLSSLVTAFFFSFGFMGMRNVLRFKPAHGPNHND